MATQEDPRDAQGGPGTTGEDPAISPGAEEVEVGGDALNAGKRSGRGRGAAGKGLGGTDKSALSDRKKNSGSPRPQKAPSAEKCTATSKHTGRRCEKYPLKGQTVCQYHGGANQVSKAAAKRRLAKRDAMIQASRLVQRDGVDMDPIDHLLDSLYRASQLVNVYSIMCAEIDAGADEELSDEQTRGELGYEIVEEEKGNGHVIDRFIVRSNEKLLALNKHSEAQLHPFLVAYTEALRDRARFAKMAIDAGIAEMQTKLVERQVDMAQEALEAAIAEMQLDKAAQRRFVEAYARNLREISTRGSAIPAVLAGAAR